MASPSDIVRQQIHPGDIIGGRYKVERFVGAGAYGAIFSAIDVDSMERVAIKALPPANQGVNKTAIGRFEREMQVISRLRHPNIITIYDFGTMSSGIIYMVIEYIDGITLYDLVTSQRLSEPEALSICGQIAAALDEAHNKGVVHRDLKPQNVMVSRLPQGGYLAKVLDFGMAKLSAGPGESVAQLTREGMAVGTPRYIAPEQARGKDVGAWSDLYALGLLFYEMFTGERAVKADTIESAIIAHVSPEPLQLDEIHMVPEHVRPVLFKLIEKKVAKRYQRASDLLRDLDTLESRHLAIDVAKTAPVGDRSISMDPDGPRPAPNFRPAPTSEPMLELDYDRYDKFAPGQRYQAPQKLRSIRESRSEFRAPQNIFEWAEAGAMVVLYPVAFILLTAQMEGLPVILRWVVGLLPIVIASVVPLTTKSPSWNVSFFRLLFGFSLLWILVAHGFGLERLGSGLLRNPAWFLRPVANVPVLNLLFDMVAGFSRAYGQILA